MPRSSFSVGTLQNATPGLSRLAASIGGGDQAYDAGYDKTATAQSKIAQALASINASNASADAHRSIATQNDAETGVLTNRPAEIDRGVAYQANAPLPLVQAVKDYFTTGVRPMKPAVGPPTEESADPAAFPVVDDATQSRIAQLLGRTVAQRTNLKDTKPDDLAKAAGEYRGQDLSDAVIAGVKPRNVVAGAQAAADGKSLYHAGENGAVLDLFGGGLDTSNPMAGASIFKANQQGEQAKAGAVENLAQAGAARASAGHSAALTDQVRQNIDAGVKTGQIQVMTDPTTGEVSLLNKATGISRPATTADGVPLKGKTSADKPLTETQGKATTFAARMQDAENTIQQLEAKGVSGSDLRTRAAGTDWTNFMASPEGQQYRQAQENWVTANLRQESGAAIGVDEMAKDVRKFFPTIGDAPAVKEQKSRARAVAQRGMVEQAGAGGKRVAAIVAGPDASTAPAQITGDADFNALPSGASFIGPDGKTRRKP